MTLDQASWYRRPRVEDVARIVHDDAYMITLPERIKLTLGDDQARSELLETSQHLQDAEMRSQTMTSFLCYPFGPPPLSVGAFG